MLFKKLKKDKKILSSVPLETLTAGKAYSISKIDKIGRIYSVNNIMYLNKLTKMPLKNIFNHVHLNFIDFKGNFHFFIIGVKAKKEVQYLEKNWVKSRLIIKEIFNPDLHLNYESFLKHFKKY